jgi:hypothetical protein
MKKTLMWAAITQHEVMQPNGKMGKAQAVANDSLSLSKAFALRYAEEHDGTLTRVLHCY